MRCSNARVHRAFAENSIPYSSKPRIIPQSIHTGIHIHYEKRRGILLNSPGQFRECSFSVPERKVRKDHAVRVHIIGLPDRLYLLQDPLRFLEFSELRETCRLVRPEPVEIRRHHNGEPELL